ncbi:MAG: hypothetical protein IPL19_20475 [Sandaracinaceae bacterium]|nr:hypothetical protein [Sandaracinaceae bacterium]
MADKEREVLGDAAISLGASVVSAASSAAGGLLLGPIGAVALPAATAMLGRLIRGHQRQRTEARANDYEASLARALIASGLTFEEFGSLPEEKQETVFQAYRRAVDAVDPLVIPALGRLTAMALRDGKDRFFVSVGRMLEQMTGPSSSVCGNS